MTDEPLLSDESELAVAPILACDGNDAAQLRWYLAGVVAGARFATPNRQRLVIRSGPEGQQVLWQGYRLRLHPRLADDYALNLGSERPSIFVVCRLGPDGPAPELVTVSLDEAQNMDATDLRDSAQTVLQTPLPPEIHRWMADFVARHYQPRRRGQGKRRRDGEYERSVEKANPVTGNG